MKTIKPGKKTNKERVKNLLEMISNQGGSASEKGIDAVTVSEKIGIKRNTASSVLNQLVNEGCIKKIKTRPVLFYYNKQKAKNSTDDIYDPFSTFIGYNKSLKEQIQKCKLAATYPNIGMPIMILGESGVGKSLLAEYIYEYAKFTKTIPSDAPFVVLNCADYVNNEELLSSALFGHTKGAFTGADKETAGLIEAADNGFLFLDEIHRLPPEGQEKLFRYIDKGFVRKFGADSKEKKLNVRLIFATTEGVHSMLDTFLRRIPLYIEIPPFSERTIEERFELICKLFSIEAETMDCRFSISCNVINDLISFNQKGNIGSLKNIIKLCCANAYSKNRGEEIKITLEDLNEYYSLGNEYPKRVFINENIEIDKHWEPYSYSKDKSYSVDQFFPYKELENVLVKYKNHTISPERFRAVINKEITKAVDKIIYADTNDLTESMYIGSVKNILDYIQDGYGFKYNGTTLTILTRLLIIVNNSFKKLDENEINAFTRMEEMIRFSLYRFYKISSIFYQMAAQSLDYEAYPEVIKVITALYFYCNMDKDNELCNAIIISHGYATASSIASMVNRLYEKYIFEAFDMPFDTPKKEIVRRVKNYLKKTDTSHGLLILVDMGSLLEIGDDLSDYVIGDLGLIDNITTQIALDVGGRILRKENIKDIVEKTVSENVIRYKFTESKRKENVIVVCCITGIGTAIKIRDMLRECFEGTAISIAEHEYEDLKKNGMNSNIFRKYNVLMVISTVPLSIIGKNTLQLNELITEKGEKLIHEALTGLCSPKKIDNIMTSIIKSFALKNIIGQLTILNPDKIIEDVESVINNIEIMYRRDFSADLKKILYMHISIMIERLILEKNHLPTLKDEKFEKCHKDFVVNVKNSFSVIESKYNVSVNTREIKMIYDLIESRDRE